MCKCIESFINTYYKELSMLEHCNFFKIIERLSSNKWFNSTNTSSIFIMTYLPFIAYIQHDHADFDRFAQFIVFRPNFRNFLFLYGWIRHWLLYRTVYFSFDLFRVLVKKFRKLEKPIYKVLRNWSSLSVTVWFFLFQNK